MSQIEGVLDDLRSLTRQDLSGRLRLKHFLDDGLMDRLLNNGDPHW